MDEMDELRIIISAEIGKAQESLQSIGKSAGEMAAELEQSGKESDSALNEIKRTIDELKMSMDTIRDVHVKINANVSEAETEIEAVKEEIRSLPNEKTVRINVRQNGNANIPKGSRGRAGAIAGLIASIAPAASPLGAAGLAGGMGLASMGAPAVVGLGGLAAVSHANISPITQAVSGYNADMQAASQATSAKTRATDIAKAQQAFDGLNQAQMQAARSLQQFEGFWKSFSASFQKPVLGMFTSSLGMLESLLKDIQPAITAAANAFSTLFQQAKTALDSPFWKQFFSFIGATAGPSIKAFGETIGNLGKGLAALLEAFAPMATTMENGLVSMTAKFAAWAQSLKGTQGFENFLKYASQSGQQVMTMLDGLAKLVGALLTDMAPLGLQMMKFVNALIQVLNTGLKTNPVFSSMVKGLLSAATEVLKFATNLLTLHPKMAQFGLDVAAGVAAFIGLKAGITSVITLVKNFGAGIGTTIKVLKGLPGNITQSINTIKSLGSTVVSVTKNVASFTVAMIKNAAQAVTTGAKLAASFIVNVVKAGVEVAATALKITGQMVVALVKMATQGAKTTASVVLMTAKLVAQGVALTAQKAAILAYNIAQKAMMLGTKLATVATTAFGVAMDVAMGPIGLVIAAVAALALGAYELIKHWSSVSKFFTKMWDDVKGEFKDFESWAGNFFTSLGKEALQWGSNMIHMFVNGIMSGVHAVEHAVSSIGNVIHSFLGHHSPAEQGPLADDDQWMPNMMNMFVEGIKKSTPQLQAALNNIVSMPNWASSMSSASSIGSSVASRYISSASGQASGQNVTNIIVQGHVLHERELTNMVNRGTYNKMKMQGKFSVT